MRVLDIHNNDRVDIIDVLLDDKRLEGINFQMPAKTSVFCAHCFRERRQVRECKHCADDVNHICATIQEDCAPKAYMRLVPSALVYSMLKEDGYLNHMMGKPDASMTPIDSGLKLFMARLNLGQTSQLLRDSMRHESGMSCQLLEMSAICIKRVSSLCPYYFSKKLLETVFKIDLGTAVADDPEEGAGATEDSWDSTDSLTAFNPETKRDDDYEIIRPQEFSDDLKSCILPGYRDKDTPHYRYFVKEVVLNRISVFKCPTHKLFFDKYMASNVNIEIKKSKGSLTEDVELAIDMMLCSVNWLQFVRSIVPEEYSISSERAYSYINTYMVHSKEDDYDLFNSMMDDYQFFPDTIEKNITF